MRLLLTQRTHERRQAGEKDREHAVHVWWLWKPRERNFQFIFYVVLSHILNKKNDRIHIGEFCCKGFILLKFWKPGKLKFVLVFRPYTKNQGLAYCFYHPPLQPNSHQSHPWRHPPSALLIHPASTEDPLHQAAAPLPRQRLQSALWSSGGPSPSPSEPQHTGRSPLCILRAQHGVWHTAGPRKYLLNECTNGKKKR